MEKANLSKFSEILSNLGQNESAPMGFGSNQQREKIPVMLLVGEQCDDVLHENVHAYIRHEIYEDKSKLWGIFGSDIKSFGWNNIKKSGCQFVIFDSCDAPSDVLLDEDVSKGMLIGDVESDSRIRAIEDSNVDFLVLRAPPASLPLNFGSAMKLQEVVSTYSKHVLLYFDSAPDGSDLDILKEMPISGILVNLSKIKGTKLNRLFQTIQKLEPKKIKREQRALIPGRRVTDSHEDHEDHEDGDFED